MKLRALIAAAALFLPGALPAQSRVTVPVQDPVYRDLDRLIALRLVEVGLYGQRPYSRREIARIVKEAQASIAARQVSVSTRNIVQRLTNRFVDDVRMLDERKTATRSSIRLAGEVLYRSSSARAIPNDSVGKLTATIDPLMDGRAGRAYGNGLNVAPEVRLEHQSAFVMGALHYRLLATGADTRGRIEAASVLIPIRNVTIEAGRQPIVWGQGMEGGLLFSSSGKPLDMVRLSTDLPFKGWFIKGTSPMRGSLIAADLGSRQYFPHSILIAYKLSGHPFTNRFELAASVLGVQGGRGAPPGSLSDHVMDLIPPLKYLLPDNTAQFSNKMAGWEYRLRLPELRGLQVYAEHAFEDMDPRRWKSTFWEDGGHIVGVSMHDLAPDGSLSAAWEFHHTGLRFYKHGVFRSGLTFNGTLFGDPLGTQGNGSYLRLSWDPGQARSLTTTVAVERRTGDSYNAVSVGPNEEDYHFERLEAFPPEWRTRLDATYQFRWRTRDLSMRAGWERVRDFAFLSGNRRHNVAFGLSLPASR